MSTPRARLFPSHSLAPASTVVPVDFARLPIIAVVGALFYAEPIQPPSWPRTTVYHGTEAEMAELRTDANFGFAVPVAVPGVDSAILDPRSTWADKAAYDRQAKKLVGMFIDNFGKFEDHVDATVRGAAPRAQEAAE